MAGLFFMLEALVLWWGSATFFVKFDHLLSHGSLQESFTYPWLDLLVFCFFCSSKWKNVPSKEETLAVQLSALQEYILQTLILSFGSPWAPTAVRRPLCCHYYYSASGPLDFVCFGVTQIHYVEIITLATFMNLCITWIFSRLAKKHLREK